MDQISLVSDRIDDGRRIVERFAADGNPVQAAFWARTTDEGQWFLYIVTELVDRVGSLETYRAVGVSREKLGESSLTFSETKVVSPNSPVGRAVLAIVARNPGRLVNRFKDTTLGPLDVDQTYIYAPHFFTFTQANPMTSEEIGRELLRLMNRASGVLQPSRVSLKDGTAFDGVPISLQYGVRNSLVVQFIADGQASPRVERLDEIAAIA